jgi:DNA replication protein DnaC
LPYSKEIFDAATVRLAQRRQAAESENAQLRQELYAKIPRLTQIERELSQTGVRVAREVLESADSAKSIERLRRINLTLQAERINLLESNGYPRDILAVNYYCGKCSDTGFVGDNVCSCLKTLLLEEACKRANSGSPLPLYDFGSFDLSYYPDKALSGQRITVRDYMGRVLNHCVNYAEHFGSQSGSLLMLGATGLGKTHLALAAANAIIRKGNAVVYDTAQNIFAKIEDEYFARAGKKFTQMIYECDLLIMDDLPDYAAAFTINTFYNIINTRSLAHRPMIVSTNLTENELSGRYGEKIFSRLIGDFMMLKFFGSDIRQLKLRKNGNL